MARSGRAGGAADYGADGAANRRADDIPHEVRQLPAESIHRLRGTVDLTAILLDVPTVVMHLEDADGNAYRIATSGEERLGELVDALCGTVGADAGPVLVEDATDDPRFRDHPGLTRDGEPGPVVRFFASAPLVTPNGDVFGRLCAGDTVPRTVTTRQTRALAALSERVTDVLAIGFRTLELERAVADLTEARAELHRSNEELSLFAGQVSHDLRNPLTAMLANAEVIASLAADDAAVAELAHAAVEAGRRMDLLMRGYLGYAQVGGELDLVEVPLTTVARAVLEDVRPVTRRTGATVRVDELPVVRADVGKVYAVLLNLVANALKFCDADRPPRLEIGAVRLDDRWRITVADRGPGVADEDRDRIFGLFERGGDPRAVPGRGMGLSVVRRVVTEHGGRVGVDDRPGGGSVFWFELPD